MKQGRPKTVEGSADSNTHTFYCAPETWKAYKAVAESLNIPASELLRRDIAATLDKYQTGQIKKPEFNLQKKQDELLEALSLERKLEKALKEIPIGKDKTAIAAFRDLAIRLGCDFGLKKDFPQVIEKMKNASIDPSLRVKFVLYGQAILNRRAIETEIDNYLSGNGKPEGAASDPLFERALAA